MAILRSRRASLATAAVGVVGLSALAACDLGVPARTYPLAAEGEVAGDVAAGDVNGDGATDLVALTTAGYAVALNDGDGEFDVTQAPAAEAPQDAVLGSGLPADAVGRVALGDLDGDGALDLVYGGAWSAGSGEVVIRPGDGAGGFAADAITLPTPAGVVWSPLLVDLDDDGRLDVVAVTAADQWDFGHYTWRNLGDGTFGPRVELFGGMADAPLSDLRIVDLNGDADLDVVLAYTQEGVNAVAVLLGTDGGALAEPVLYHRGDVTTYGRRLAVADLDADGDTDIAGRDADRQLFTLLNDGSGAFEEPVLTTVPEGTRVTDLAAADVDGDGNVDLAGDTVVAFGAGDGTFPAFRTVAGGREVVATDLDGDLDPDLASLTANRLIVLLNELDDQAQ